MTLFLLGAVMGAAIAYVFYWQAQRLAAQLAEEKTSLLEERQIVLDYMHTMVDAVGERLPRDELFQRIVHASILSTGALSACIFEKTADDQMRGVAVEGLFPPHRPLSDLQNLQLGSRAKFIEHVLRSESFPVGEGIVGRVAATGRGELIADAPRDPRIVRHQDPALIVRSVIAAPIMVRERLIGVLCVCNAADGLPFTPTDYSLVEALAEQAALAVHNADFLALQVEKQRLDLDLALASDVQKMLLPHEMPQVPGLEIDARYVAAQKVSGDFYDVFVLGPGRVGLAVADVSGKGLPASLLMAICRTLLRAIAPRHHSPAAALAEMNRELIGELGGGMYVTMIYAIIDVDAGTLTFARAGHELPLVRRPHGGGVSRPEFLGSEGMPLGLVESETFDSVTVDRDIPFAEGATLVLFTDGLTEAAREDGREFGSARLADAVQSAGDQRSAQGINEHILQNLNAFCNAGPSDDVTLVTIRRRG